MDFQKLAGYAWPQDTPRLFVPSFAPTKSASWFCFDKIEALSQAQAGAVPFMKIPSALRSAERAAGLPTISSVPAMAGFWTYNTQLLCKLLVYFLHIFLLWKLQVRKNFGLNPKQPVAQEAASRPAWVAYSSSDMLHRLVAGSTGERAHRACQWRCKIVNAGGDAMICHLFRCIPNAMNTMKFWRVFQSCLYDHCNIVSEIHV